VVPILTQDSLDFISHSGSQTERIGLRLAQLCQPGDVICLEGPLGAGKTCLTKGIGRGLDIAEPITSPTFVLIHEHRVPGSGMRLFHIDLYRLEEAASSRAEALGLGLDEYLYGDGVCVIEWPERARELLPPEHLWITLGHIDENKRRVCIKAIGPRYQQMISQLRKSAFGLES